MPSQAHHLSISNAAALLRSRELTAVELVNGCLARVEAWIPRLNAFITVLTDAAREQARARQSESNAGQWRGPLHGIPVAVKDFYDTAGVRTTAAFEKFANRIPARDAEAVATLK